MDKNDSIEYILNLANMQDSLLQGYRSMSLTLQSIFIAIASGLAIAVLSFSNIFQSISSLVMLTSTSVLSIFLLAKVRRIILARGNDVNFWHKKLIKLEQELPNDQRYFTEFKIHQKLKREQSESTSNIFNSFRKIEDGDIDLILEKGLGHTRKILDKWLFVGLLFIWLIIIAISYLYVILHHLLGVFK
jgi:hypothetical protein